MKFQPQQLHHQHQIQASPPESSPSVLRSKAPSGSLTRTRLDSGTQTAVPPTQQLEERLATLELVRLRANFELERQRWAKERDAFEAAQQVQVREVVQQERNAAEVVCAELEAARWQAADRADELNSALSTIAHERGKLEKRAKEASHWRAAASRANGTVEALTDHCERQNEKIKMLETETAGQREALMAMRDAGELQCHALLASEGARAVQSAVTQVPQSAALQNDYFQRPGTEPPPSTPFIDILASGELRPPKREWPASESPPRE